MKQWIGWKFFDSGLLRLTCLVSVRNLTWSVSQAWLNIQHTLSITVVVPHGQIFEVIFKKQM